MDTPQIEPARNPSGPQSQPIQAMANLDPQLDEAAVRQAIAAAEANNLDPQTLTMEDLAQGSLPNPNPALAQPKAPEVPQKFLKSDGEVDVDKIVASTQALDAAIQKKEEAVTKTVDDYMREYNERETKFRTMPNPERLAANLPPPPVQSTPPPVADTQDYDAIVRRDWQQDPLMTTARMIDIAIQERFKPIEAKEKNEGIRSNLVKLSETDPRVMREDVFAAINAKLASEPSLWKMKNPHRSAWLEVKEEMRLGDAPQGASAQPRVLSPVLGGGTPPSTPLSSTPAQPQDVVANINRLNLLDPKQEAAGDAAIRAMLSRG